MRFLNSCPQGRLNHDVLGRIELDASQVCDSRGEFDSGRAERWLMCANGKRHRRAFIMRDLFLVVFVAISLIYILRYPFVGILVWEFFTLMNPQQEAYGMARTLPLNMIVAGATLLGWLVSPEPKKIPRNAITTVSLIFLAWMTFNSFFAFDPSWSWPYWDRTWRVFALGFLIAATANTKARIDALIWVAAISLMYYGVKGGVFTVMTGGAHKVFGPESTIIGDNNQLALALLMTIPLIEYLRTSTPSKTLSLVLAGCMASTTVAVLGSYSRGAYIAMGALAVFFLYHSKRRFLYLLAGGAIAVFAVYFMPQSFFDRIDTMNSLNTDNSFQGRVMAWQVAFSLCLGSFSFRCGFYGPNCRASSITISRMKSTTQPTASIFRCSVSTALSGWRSI